MRATWVKVAGMGIALMVLGCRTPKPNLKPEPVAEALNTPPSEKRFDQPVYPKEAFNIDRDPLKKLNQDDSIQPVRGPGMGPGGTQGPGGRPY